MHNGLVEDAWSKWERAFIMAGDWIKVECVTPDKPEVHQLAEQLSIDPDAVVGKLVRIWIWADQQTYDGNAGSVTLALLDRCTCVTGFGKALVNVGWLNRTERGFVFPKFELHNGQTAKQRGLTARRVGRHRVTQMKRSCNDASVTPSSLITYSSLEDLIKNEDLKGDSFKRAWDEWVKYRQEIKKRLTKSMAEKQIAKFDKWGLARSVAAIDHTIAQGWVGLREPESDPRSEKPEMPQI